MDKVKKDPNYLNKNINHIINQEIDYNKTFNEKQDEEERDPNFFEEKKDNQFDNKIIELDIFNIKTLNESDIKYKKKIIEIIKSNPLFFDFEDDYIETLMHLRGVNIYHEYSHDKIKELELIIADLYIQISLNPYYSEGSLSVKFQKEELLFLAKGIYKKYNDPKFILLQEENKTKKIEVLCSNDSKKW